MPIDIIYVNYNSTDHLIKSVKSLFESNCPNRSLNVIVVDNHSNDQAHRLKNIFPEIKLILNKKKLWFRCSHKSGIGFFVNQNSSF